MYGGVRGRRGQPRLLLDPSKNRVALVEQLAITMLVERFGVGGHEVSKHLSIDDQRLHPSGQVI